MMTQRASTQNNLCMRRVHGASPMDVSLCCRSCLHPAASYGASQCTCVSPRRGRSPIAFQCRFMTGAAQVAKRTGAIVEVIPETEDGDIDIAALEALVRREPRPALISVSHVPTSSGAAPCCCWR